jgi:protein O-GlcNAc transferase
VLYLKKGKLEEAQSEYKKALEIKPGYVKSIFNLGYIYHLQGRTDEAIASFLEVLKIQPDDAEAHTNLAAIYYEKKEYRLAIQHVDQAMKLGKNVDPRFLEHLKPYR